jgi:hypothetical protein
MIQCPKGCEYWCELEGLEAELQQPDGTQLSGSPGGLNCSLSGSYDDEFDEYFPYTHPTAVFGGASSSSAAFEQHPAPNTASSVAGNASQAGNGNAIKVYEGQAMFCEVCRHVACFLLAER